MDEIGIKNERLQQLMKAARNAGGTIEADMLDALKRANIEHKFEMNWFYNLRNELKWVNSRLKKFISSQICLLFHGFTHKFWGETPKAIKTKSILRMGIHRRIAANNLKQY